MGLDAGVYCNCFERGMLLTPPPPGCNLSVGPDGGLLPGSDDLEVEMAFDRWRMTAACEHEDGYLAWHHLGNIALVALLREELGQWPERFPMILSRVIYNGIHGGDMLTVTEVAQMFPEVEALAGVHSRTRDREQFLREFEAQMKELVATSMTVGKPIVF